MDGEDVIGQRIVAEVELLRDELGLSVEEALPMATSFVVGCCDTDPRWLPAFQEARFLLVSV